MDDDPAEVERWRADLHRHGVWANKPVPLFPYPGSPDYTRRWGAPDDFAWERAHESYLSELRRIQRHSGAAPAPLVQLESSGWHLPDGDIRRVLMTGDTRGRRVDLALELAGALAATWHRSGSGDAGRRPSPEQREAAAAIPNLCLLTSRYKLEWMNDPWA